MGKRLSARPAANSDDAMTVSPSATAVSKLVRGRVRIAVARKRGDERALRLAAGLDRRPGRPARAHVDKVDPLRGDDALQAAHVERHCERVFGRRREADEEAADRLQFAGQPAENRSPPAPARRSPPAPRSTASVARSSPPAASGGTIWRIVRPASGAFAPRRKGESASTLTAGRAIEHENVTGERLTRVEGSAKSASPCAPTPMFIPARSAGSVIRSELNVPDGQPQVFIVGNAPNQRRIAFRRRAPVRDGGPGLVWLSGYRSDMDFDQGERARRGGRAARSRPAQVRLFRPWAIRRAARGWDDLPLARGDADAVAGRKRGTADSGRLVHGRISGVARRPSAERGRRERSASRASFSSRLRSTSPKRSSGPRRRTRRGARSWMKACGEGPPPIRASPIASPAI